MPAMWKEAHPCSFFLSFVLFACRTILKAGLAIFLGQRHQEQREPKGLGLRPEFEQSLGSQMLMLGIQESGS